MENNLKKIRKDRRVTVDRLSEILDCSPQYYYELERGDKRINEDILNPLADFYGVTTDFLLGRTNNKQAVILSGNSLPEELKEYCDEIEVLREAVTNGLTKEDIQIALDFAKKVKGIK